MKRRIFLVCLFYCFFSADLRIFCGYFLAICQLCFNFFGSDFLNGFPNSFVVHYRPFLNPISLCLQEFFLFTCGFLTVIFSFFKFFNDFFGNGFLNSLMVRSRSRFCLVNESSLNFTSELVLLRFSLIRYALIVLYKSRFSRLTFDLPHSLFKLNEF